MESSIKVSVSTEEVGAVTTGKKKRNRKKKKKDANKENEVQTNRPTDGDDSDEEDEFEMAARLMGLQKKKTTKLSLTHTVSTKKSVPDEKRNDDGSSKATNGAKSSKSSKGESGVETTIIAIGSDPSLIIGTGGSKIQSIESLSGASLEILNNTPEPNKHSVRIKGTTEQSLKIAIEMVKEIVGAEEIRIANSKTVVLGSKDIKGPDGVKAIIGRRGETIKEIQLVCGKELRIDANVDEGTVTLSGPKDKVDEAVILCKNAVFGEAQHMIDLKTRSAVNIVFGKDFGTIRDIQTKSGAKLDIEKGTNKLKLSGKKEQVEEARKAVTELLQKHSGRTMTIKASDIGAVYGKAGSKIRSIQDRTGAFIDVDQPKGSDTAEISIMGEANAVNEAEKLIKKAISGEIELKAGEVLETMKLGAATPAVIGKAGSRVKELEKEHKVRINVNSQSGICSVVGTAAAVKSAKGAIDTIMAPMLMEEAATREAAKMQNTGDITWTAPPADEELDGW